MYVALANIRDTRADSGEIFREVRELLNLGDSALWIFETVDATFNSA